MLFKKIDFYVGLFVLTAVIALSLLAFNVSNYSSISKKDGYTVTAKFSNIGSLRSQSPVSSSGVLVGRVESVGFDNTDYQAEITLQIFDPYKFPIDTAAIIYTSGLLGEQYISLEPGGEIDFLEDGDEIEITQSALVLEKLIGQFLLSQSEGNK